MSRKKKLTLDDVLQFLTAFADNPDSATIEPTEDAGGELTAVVRHEIYTIRNGKKSFSVKMTLMGIPLEIGCVCLWVNFGMGEDVFEARPIIEPKLEESALANLRTTARDTFSQIVMHVNYATAQAIAEISGTKITRLPPAVTSAPSSREK
jgi:hypothetical protein